MNNTSGSTPMSCEAACKSLASWMRRKNFYWRSLFKMACKEKTLSDAKRFVLLVREVAK